MVQNQLGCKRGGIGVSMVLMVQDFSGPERSGSSLQVMMKRGWVVEVPEEGLDGAVFRNGLERGQAHHWAVERVCTVHQFGVG